MIQQTMDASHLSLTFVTCTHHESAYTDYVSKRRSGIQQQRHCVGLHTAAAASEDQRVDRTIYRPFHKQNNIPKGHSCVQSYKGIKLISL